MTWINIQESYPPTSYTQRRPVKKYSPGYLLRAFIFSGGYVSATLYFHDGTTAIDRSGGNFSNYTWAHITMVRDKTIGKGLLYVNGALVGSINDTARNIDSSNSVLIAAEGFIGYVDDVRIYNRALSAAEIQAIYNATR
jgi:hypothetical protein